MASKKKLNKIVKHRKGTLERRELKNKVRKSPLWQELRETLKEMQGGLDLVTMRPLIRGYQLHHLSQNADFYGDLNPDRFVATNYITHRFLHYCYDIYKRDGNFTFLDKIKDLITKMVDITNYDETRLDSDFYKELWK